MPVKIIRVGQSYRAEVTPPHGGGDLWSSPALSADELIKELLARGCHETDIGDAFYEADPGWLERVESRGHRTLHGSGDIEQH